MTVETKAEQETLHISFRGKELDLPLVTGTENETGVDITRLRSELGLITLDPGLANTGACRSDITFINGEEGILRYRGYPIEQLAGGSSFLEVAWLLLEGELPTQKQLDGFTAEITRHTMLHEDFKRFFSAMPKDAHPMPTCAAAVGAMATFYQEPESDELNRKSMIRLLAKMPTIAAFSYKHSLGQPFVYPRNDLDYTSNFLHMMFATPCEEYTPDPVIARAIDLLLLLHADHEQNCSTSTVRLVASSRANLFASIAAGISALWGPLHGGANQKVIEMLETIDKEHGSARKFLDKAKDRQDTTRLMGFGHRVYKNYDPRATILKQACADVSRRLGKPSRLLEIALELEQIALSDDYFISHRLYPNVDFYSGVIYKAIGIPENMFTVMFAMGRLAGWMTQWKELSTDPAFRIGRPRQVYVGPTKRSFVPMEERG